MAEPGSLISLCKGLSDTHSSVPYGTLLCVLDKPLHSEINLPGSANAFYERAVSQHSNIGIAAVDLMRSQLNSRHSPKLRSFDEPPFRLSGMVI